MKDMDDIMGKEALPIKALEKIEDICVHAVDSNGKVICYSKGCEIIDDMKYEEVINHHLNEIYTYMENESMQEFVLKTGKTVRDVHVKYTTPSGKIADVISSTYPIVSKEDKGGIEGAICVYRDISGYMKMSEKILELENKLKSKEKKNGTQYTLKSIKGSSKAILKTINEAKVAACTEAPVLLIGETGTGKEVFAQSIHNSSKRAEFPFIAINCSAIPDSLLESTLFGTVKGSFTGASDKKGLIEEAKGGTLFLDEINSMNYELQSKILRVLETKRFRKVGGNKEIIMDARVISALNEDPLKAIDEKKLRADLFYRLAVFSIAIPSLNDRKSDIIELARYFLRKEAENIGKDVPEITREAMEILIHYNWPGNIRELKHVITHAVYMTSSQDPDITAQVLPHYLREHTNIKKNDVSSKYFFEEDEEKTLKSTLDRIEKEILKEILEANNFNVSKSARDLGLARQNLQYRIKRFGLEKQEKK